MSGCCGLDTTGGAASAALTMQETYIFSAGASPTVGITAANGAMSFRGNAAVTDILVFEDDLGATTWRFTNSGDLVGLGLLDVAGNVTFESDLTLDGATGAGDLDMVGNLTMTAAGAILDMGVGTGAPRIELDALGGATRDFMTWRFVGIRQWRFRVSAAGTYSMDSTASGTAFAITQSLVFQFFGAVQLFDTLRLDLDATFESDLILDGATGNGDILMAGDLDPSTNLGQDVGADAARFKFVYMGVPAPEATATLDNETYTFDDDGIVVVQATVGDVTGNLPAVTAADTGKTYQIILLTTANNFLLTPNGTDTINGVNAADTLVTQGRYWVTCTGAGAWSSQGPVSNT